MATGKRDYRRPDYCRAEEPNECTDCQATIRGNDPVNGVCQARYGCAPPDYGLRLILVDRDTGSLVE
jgi:hypothetical protein